MAITTLEIDINTGDSIKSLSELKNEFKDIEKQLSGLTPGTEEYINALKKLYIVLINYHHEVSLMFLKKINKSSNHPIIKLSNYQNEVSLMPLKNNKKY